MKAAAFPTGDRSEIAGSIAAMSADEQREMVWDRPLNHSSYIVYALVEEIDKLTAARDLIIAEAEAKYRSASPGAAGAGGKFFS